MKPKTGAVFIMTEVILLFKEPYPIRLLFQAARQIALLILLKKGGGIYIAGGTVIIEHTSINGNTVETYGEGKGIYVADGTFEMKAGAKIDENNDVYLKSSKK